MKLPRKSVLALIVVIPGLGLAGCQKANDTPSPTAAVSGPNGKTDQSNAIVDAAEGKPEQDTKHPVYEFDTTAGKITVRLDEETAPLTVDNFRNYVAHGHYDLTIFHQVVKQPVQVVLGGAYTADLKEKTPFTPIRNEADKSLQHGLKNHRGTIAMARRSDDEDSANCQFFFNMADNDSLNFKARTAKDYGYCVFGEVTAGMDVLDRIAKGPVHDSGTFQGLPVETVAIKTVRQIK